MKQSTRYTLLLCLLLLGVPVYANITIDGESVHVETDSYVVQFNKGVIEHIHNKLTNETYTLPKIGRRGWTGLLFRRHYDERENISTRRATLISATLLNSRNAELLFRQEGTEVRLFIAVDSMTDDLVIDIEGVSDTPGVIGMQWGLGYLDIQNLSLIVPTDGGRIIDADTATNYRYHAYPSSSWEAQLAIAQGERGGFYVRNTDNTLQYKVFLYDRYENGFALQFGTHNQAPFDNDTMGNSTMWRLNTYTGNWRVPARIYRDWMERAFQPTRLSDMPAWVEDITLFVKTPGAGIEFTSFKRMIDRLAELVDPTKTILYFGKWVDGGDWWSAEHDEPFPDFFPKPELRRFVEAAHEHGYRVMPYLIVHGFSPNHPLYPEFQQYQYRNTWTGELMGANWDTPPTRPSTHRLAFISPASSAYRNLLVQRLKPLWQEYGFDGFFLDASHFVINDGSGLIDGLNMAQGMALLHKELAEAMPGIALGGERLHEATFVHESFAQRPLLTRKLQRHPISAFLFSPFVHAIALGPTVPDHDPTHHQEVLRYSEIWDIMPTINIWGVDHLDEEDVEVHKSLTLARTWQTQYGLNGDVNDDGIVNVLDLTLVGQNFGVTFDRPQTDVDGDGQVNVLDLIIVANMFGR